MRISVVINGDTRAGVFDTASQQGSMHKGTKSLDYLKEGVDNKLNFFRGYEVESHLYIDIHEPLGKDQLWDISQRVDNLVLHKHVEYYQDYHYYTKHIDLNILNAIIASRGDYVAHFDWDMAAFRKDDSEIIDRWIGWLDEGRYDYVSYPSRASPRAVNDDDFSYDWASSRFFLCKRQTLDHTEIMKCLNNTEYLFNTYAPKDTARKCGWLEHVQGMMAGKGKVFYPPMQNDDHMIFSWSNYFNGLFGSLNEMKYEDVLNYVRRCGRIQYPCDVYGRVLR